MVKGLEFDEEDVDDVMRLLIQAFAENYALPDGKFNALLIGLAAAQIIGINAAALPPERLMPFLNVVTGRIGESVVVAQTVGRVGGLN